MVALAATIESLSLLGTALELVPIIGPNLKAAAELASAICEKAQKVQEHRESYEQLAVQVGRLLMAISSALQRTELERLGAMKANVAHFMEVLEEIQVVVEKRLPSTTPPTRKRDKISGWLRKTGKDVFLSEKIEEEIQEMRRKLQEVVEEFEVSSLMRNELSISAVRHITSLILDRVNRLDAANQIAARDADNAILDTLNPLTSASWDVVDTAFCSPGTRVALLDDLWSWVESPSRHPYVFWMNGLAGTGKSTLARSLCQRLEENGRLAASFFISRQQTERRDSANIVRTLAHQIALRQRSFAQALCAELRERPMSSCRSLQKLITDLIVQPARAIDEAQSFIFVIDALDETWTDTRGRQGGELLPLLVRGVLQLSGRLRLFITSRAESAIQAMFHQLSATAQQAVVQLHDLDKTLVQADIRTYLVNSFADIRADRPGRELDDWPDTHDIKRLVHLSGALFVYAATVIRFVDNRRYSPRARLASILDGLQTGGSASPYRLLDQLYLQVLRDVIQTDDDDEEVLCDRIRVVAGAIVLAGDALSVDALADLTRLSSEDTLITVQSLSSLLLAVPNKPVRIFHPSLPDFITDASRCTDPRFCISPPTYHKRLARSCLSLMNHNLRYNICDLEDPSVANDDQPNVRNRIHQNISEALDYACRSWTLHLTASAAYGEDLSNELHELCSKHLLHWLEVLSLTCSLSPIEQRLSAAITWCEVNSVRDQTVSLLRDVLLTARIYGFALRTHAVHTYHTAFVTMPECTLLDSLTHGLVPDTLPRLVSPRESQWVPGPWILEGHDASVCAVAVSPDGLRIVSGSWDNTVRVWDANTGETLARLTAHQRRVTAVAFSPDGTRFVSGSEDSTVRIWSTVSFEVLAELTGHSDAARVTCVGFVQTTEGERIVSASQGYFEVLAWDAVTFIQLDLELNTDYLAAQVLRCSMDVLSSTGKLLAATFDDSSLRVWETVSLCQVARLRVYGHVNIAFACDGSRLITGSRDGSVTTWNTTTFEQLFTFQARQTHVTLLPDGQLYVHGCSSASWPWDPLTFGLAVEKLGNEGRTGGRVRCAAITPNGKHVVSGSRDDTLRIWDVAAFEKAFSGLHEGQEDTILDLSISPDGSKIVSCTKDGTVNLWDGYDTKELTKVDERDAEHVFSYVAFSADGAWIALSSKRAVQVWDASTLRKCADLVGRAGQISFFPDGQRIMILQTKTCVVWTWQTGARAERKENAGPVMGAVSPDGMHIALGLTDDTVRVWDADTLKEIAKLKGHTYMVWSVAFSPDGGCIASGGFDPDCSVRIWSARTFQPLATLDGTGRTVSHVMFSPDGRIVACRDEWRRGRAWIACNAERTEWIDIRSAPQNLTANIEWLAFSLKLAGGEPGWLECITRPSLSLWLPVERRARKLASAGSRVVVGGETGALTIIDFPA